MPNRRLPKAAFALFVVAVLGCSGDDPADAGRTSTTPPIAPTTITAPEDSFAVPDQIDADYVERVANELLRILGDGRRLAVQAGEVTLEVADRWNEVYEPSVAHSALAVLTDQADRGFPGIRSPPGDARISVSSVSEATPGCMVADVIMSLSDVRIEGDDTRPRIIVLWRGNVPASDREYNGTPWTLRSISTADQFRGDLNGCDVAP